MRRFNGCWTLLACGTAVGLLWKTNEVSSGVRQGLISCSNVVIPALFPFMILAGLIAATPVGGLLSKLLYPLTGRLAGMPHALGSVLLMSFLGGFPVGARMLSELYQRREISRDACQRALCCCVNAGPSFLISAVGAGMLGSRQAGVFLLLAQLLSALAIGTAVFWPYRQTPAQSKRPSTADGGGFVQAVQGAAAGMLGICAFVVAFSALSALLRALGILPFAAALLGQLFPRLGSSFFDAALTGLLEVTNGCVAAAQLHTREGFILCAFLVSFSSFSILFQIRSCFPADTDLSFAMFYRSRLAHGLLSALLAGLFWRWLPVQVLSAIASSVQPVPVATPNRFISSICLVCMCTILLFPQSSAVSRFHTGILRKNRV
ncbi:MAG: hypothetical protein HFG20_05460 [Anaerotruncus sp.]|nr:hypothetical protein [Anaerotruncus sp.]